MSGEADSQDQPVTPEPEEEAAADDPGPADEQVSPAPPVPSTEALERLRGRLIAKYYGRKR
jgi:hypothetical protein